MPGLIRGGDRARAFMERLADPALRAAIAAEMLPPPVGERSGKRGTAVDSKKKGPDGRYPPDPEGPSYVLTRARRTSA